MEFFWIIVLALLLISVVPNYSTITKYGMVLAICLTVAAAYFHEASLYFKPIEGYPKSDIDYTFNHYKFVANPESTVPDIIVWLSDDNEKQYLFRFPYDEKSKDLKKKYDDLKKKNEQGEPTRHRMQNYQNQVYDLILSPNLIEGQTKD